MMAASAGLLLECRVWQLRTACDRNALYNGRWERWLSAGLLGAADEFLDWYDSSGVDWTD